MAAGDLCTVDDVKAASSPDLSDWTIARLPAVITAVSRAVEDHVDRLFHQETATRGFPTAAGETSFSTPDLVVLTSAAFTPAGGSTVTVIPGAVLDPVRGLVTVPAPVGGGVVSLTGAWGPASVPEQVKEAAVDSVIHWIAAAPRGDRFDDEIGVGYIRESALTYRSRQLLTPFRRWSV